MKVYRSADLVQLGRHIPTPFLLEAYKGDALETIQVDEILRVVPKKRLIAKAKWRGSVVIAKLFFAPMRWRRNLSSDIAGIQLLKESNLRTPAILHKAQIAGKKGALLVLQYLDEGKTIMECLKEAKTKSEKQAWLSKAIRSLAACHRCGLWQSDIHTDNFLQLNNQIYYLDGGAIQAIEDSFETEIIQRNLSLFLAQFTVDNDENIESLLNDYCVENKNLNIQSVKEIKIKVKEARILRLTKYEKKLLRSTTAHRRIKSLDKFAMYDRRIHSSSLENFIDDPNNYIKNDKLMKDGNSTTVAEFSLEDKNYVIKRYNLKSFWQKFKYLFKLSRAAHCWKNALVLRMLGIDTPRPIILVEDRLFGVFRRKAYLVSEKIEAPNLLEYTAEERVEQSDLPIIVQLFRNLFQTMIDYKISHGDMKASNFIFHNDKLIVLDLDGMRRHRSKRSFEKAITKDFDRFLRNWKDGKYKEHFGRIIEELKISF